MTTEHTTGSAGRVIITERSDIDLAPSIAMLEAAGFAVDVHDVAHAPEVPEALRDAVALIVGFEPVGEALFAQLPNLAVVSTVSVGVDMVDAVAAHARGIEVIGVGTIATEEVAAHALTLMLAIERRLLPALARVEQGGWIDGFDAEPRRLSELRLGLFGCGRIGSKLAGMAAPIVREIVAFDIPEATMPDGVRRVSFDELVETSDVLSIHAPATPSTVGAFDAATLARMRPGSTLINTSRGAIVDEAALAAALHAGTPAWAGLDVLVGDPPAPDSPLLGHPRALVTPHSGFLSVTSLRGYAEHPGRAILAWAARERG